MLCNNEWRTSTFVGEADQFENEIEQNVPSVEIDKNLARQESVSSTSNDYEERSPYLKRKRRHAVRRHGTYTPEKMLIRWVLNTIQQCIDKVLLQ